MRVLYLSYTGLLEPLGQSQIFAYIRELATSHSFTLVTFEKRADLGKTQELAAMERACADAGIRWRRRVYHRKPRLLATAWDVAVLAFVTLAEILGRRPQLIHCRSYIPAFVAAAFRTVGGPPYVFDTRALWLEEMMTAGRLRRGSILHRLLAWGERVALRRASGVVSLTHAAIPHFRRLAGAAPEDPRFVVIPTCVDVDRFAAAALPRVSDTPTIIGCLGTVLSGWFKLDWLLAFFEAVERRAPNARFRLVTRDDPAGVRAALGPWATCASDRLEVFRVSPEDVPMAVADFTISPFFYATGLARLAGCPTRLGELIAAGVPVIANTGSGDVDEILTRYHVGVLVNEPGPAAMDHAAAAALAMLQDPDLPARCRQAAQEWFSLEGGVRRFCIMYDNAYSFGR